MFKRKSALDSAINYKDPNEEKVINRRDVLKTLAKGVGMLGVVNVAGALGAQALSRYHEHPDKNPLVLTDSQRDFISEIPLEIKKNLIARCEDYVSALGAIKTEEQIQEINDARVPGYKKDDFMSFFSAFTALMVGASGTLIVAGNTIDKMDKLGVKEKPNFDGAPSFAHVAAIVASAATQVPVHKELEDARYMKEPFYDKEGDKNIYQAKIIFAEELKAGNKIAEKDIAEKIQYLRATRKSLQDSLYNVKN